MSTCPIRIPELPGDSLAMGFSIQGCAAVQRRGDEPPANGRSRRAGKLRPVGSIVGLGGLRRGSFTLIHLLPVTAISRWMKSTQNMRGFSPSGDCAKRLRREQSMDWTDLSGGLYKVYTAVTALLIPRLKDVESKLQTLSDDVKSMRNENLLTEAFRNRALAATLMDEDWVGLELLAHLAASKDGCTISELANVTERSMDEIAPLLAQLVRFGGAEARPLTFVCTDKGRDVIRNLEESTNAKLHP